ncbi:MAG: glycosyltransferase family 4 protein [Holophagaceae bacterium]
MSQTSTRLAIVVSHPIQYYAPWFRHLAQQPDLEVRVFHLWDFGVTAQVDRGFGHTVQWDIPLLEGYASEFVPNASRDPGTHHFSGLDNPDLVPRLEAWRADAILLFGYAHRSHLRVILSRRLRKVPLLFRGDSHDLARPHGLRPWLGRMARRLLFRRFAAFLSVGKAHTDYLRNSGVPEAKIVFAPHAVDNDRFRAAASEAERDAKAWRGELGIPEGARVFLFAGKLESKKQPLALLEAFLAMMASPEPPSAAALLFVGSGVLEDTLKARAAEAGTGHVFFAPFQNQSRMPRVYAAGDVLVLPSFGPLETWGLAVNEAMNLGRPVIVSSHVGCARDLVVPGRTGWVFEAGNPESLARVLREAARLPGDALRGLGEAACRHVETYSLEAVTAGLRATLARHLPPGPRGPEPGP